MEPQKDEEIPSSSKKEEAVAPVVEKIAEVKNSQTKIARGTKKVKIDTDTGQSSDKKDTKDDDGDAKIVRSLKRSCELWSLEDKNTFFKAINEYGKDFDALQTYFLSQGKKKGLPENMIKNKEQIRHFYYRTWLKISKHLKFSEDVKKACQEIYGLINYGELRRKLPRTHEKVLLKLNELIYLGSTQVRLRGKTMRIKTPICRALRKLNQLEDWQEEMKLPSRVTVELRPGNNATWWEVQAHSMNPRVRTILPIQKRLSALIGFLQQRWNPAKYILSPEMENKISDLKEPKFLRVAPQEGAKIGLPKVNLGDYLTTKSVSFNSYEKRLGLKSSRDELLGAVQHLKGVGKKTIKKKTDKKLLIKLDDPTSSVDNNSDLDGIENNINSDKNNVSTPVDKSSVEIPEVPNRYPGRETIERIRQGWTLEESNSITIGDLFLMFGKDSKIVLEYWWQVPDNNKDNQATSSECPAESGARQDEGLCLALRKLLSIAKLHYETSKVYENSGSNATVISSRIPSTKESTFRRPLLPQPYHKLSTHDAFKNQLDKFKTRFCEKGKTLRQRSLIVQRPTPPNKQQEEPVIAKIEPVEAPVNNTGQENQEKLINFLPIEEPQPTTQQFLTGSPRASNSIITSATQILKEGEGQWLNCEVADYSLSSFLGQFESPVKSGQRSQVATPIGECRPSSDVVSQMQCLMGENSVDYMAKFANLASQMASDNQETMNLQQ